MKAGNRKQPLSRAAQGWPCPRCGEPLAPWAVTLSCYNPQCRFIHGALLSLQEAGEVVGLSAKEIGDMIEHNELRVRVSRDSIGRVRGRFLDVLDLWRHSRSTG